MCTLHAQVEHELTLRLGYEKEYRKIMLELANLDDEVKLAQVAALEECISITNEWMLFLTPAQYLVVNQHLIYGRSWRCVEVEYYHQFSAKDHVTTDELMHLLHTAIDCIVRNMDQEAFTILIGFYG